MLFRSTNLIGHLRRDRKIGIVGPVSNNVGNEAKVAVGYEDVEDLPRWAAGYTAAHAGETFPIEMLGFFCVVFSRAVYDAVGPLDERFGLGNFEDDDYCRRITLLGYEVRYASDAFVHHWQHASFKLLPQHVVDDLFAANKAAYEAKWAVAWNTYATDAEQAVA